jgi:phospholipase/carboxylesterase
MNLDIETVDTARHPVGSVIWLHGLGQDSSSMKAVSAQLELTRAGVRSVYVNAPHRTVGLVRKTPARAWFIQTVSSLNHADATTLTAMRRELHTLLEAESGVVGSTRIVMAGFSQGAAMALSVGLRHPARLGGLALYAPFMVSEGDAAGALSQVNAGLPVWIGHGRRDWTVPMTTGEEVRDTLVERGYAVSWHRYPGVHEPFAGAAADLRRFIEATLLARTAAR